MTSLLHHHHYPAITTEEAESYVRTTGPWGKFLLTPWPLQSLIEGAVILGVGGWAGIALGTGNVWAGIGVFAAGVAVAVLVAAPGAYTETHQEFASHYFAALRVHGDGEVRAHPYLVLVVFPLLCALVGAFGGFGDESTTVRLIGAGSGLVVGLVYALVRVRRARQHPLD
jgi:hypothetical protein